MKNWENDSMKHYYREEHLKKYESDIGKSHSSGSAGTEGLFIIMMIFGIIACCGCPPIGALIIIGAYKMKEG